MDAGFMLPLRSRALIGRDEQLAALTRFFSHVRQGAGQCVLVCGEAGIGKSRLVSEAAAEAIAQGALLFQGHCFPTDLAYPYAPLLDMVRTYLALPKSHPLASRIATLANSLAPLLPELVSPAAAPQPSLEPEQEQRRLFGVFTAFFLDCAAHAPTLLIIEDLHWCDETSLEFLHQLTRHIAAHRFMVLATYRHDEAPPSLQNWLAQLNRERRAQVLQLTPFTRNDLAAMLGDIFDARHTAGTMRRFLYGNLLDTLVTLTDGNPFFVEETLGALVAAKVITYDRGYWQSGLPLETAVPQSAAHAVEQQTTGLSQAARHLLHLAAVVGRHFDVALLQRLTGYDDPQLLSLLKELVAARLVSETSADQFTFRHALTRQAVYQQLLIRERRALHRTIAEMLQIQETGEQHVEAIAYHFYQAEIWPQAATYAHRAGAKAARIYAHRAAITYYSWAIAAAQQQHQLPAPATFRARGYAYETLGEFEQAQRDYLSALDGARASHDDTATWQAANDLGCLWTARDYLQAETWFQEALKLSRDLGPPLQAHSLNRIGNWQLNREQPYQAHAAHQAALALFEQVHDAQGMAETLDFLGMSSYLGGDLPRGTAYYRQAIAQFRSLDNRPGLTSSLATLALRGATYQTDGLAATANLIEVSREVEEALQIARTIGQRSAEAYALFQLGLCLGSYGAYGPGLNVAQQSLAIAEEIEHHQWQAAAHTVLGGMYRGMLAYPQALAHYEHALSLAQTSGSLFWIRAARGYLASISIQLGDLARAEALLYDQLPAGQSANTMAQRLLQCAAIELALARGDPERALAQIEQLVPADQATQSLRLLMLRGTAQEIMQQPGAAEETFRGACTLARALATRPLEWRIHVALGNLYQVAGRATEALSAFAAAGALIKELAATIDDQELRASFLHQAMTLIPHGDMPVRRPHIPGGLTRREWEIAALIAQGKSNQEIADACVVSKRTVETHITNILGKLGYASRTQIALWVNGVSQETSPEPDQSA